MKKKLLKKCQKSISVEQREMSMLVVGREMFDRKVPKRDIPMYNVREGKMAR